MAITPYTEDSTVRTDWTIDGSNQTFDLSITPASWSVHAYVNGSHAKIVYVDDKDVRLAVAPEAPAGIKSLVQFRYAVSDTEDIVYPTDYTEEDSDGTLTGDIDGSNVDFTLSETPDPWNVFAFINGTFVACSVSGAVITLAVAPATGSLVTIRYTYGGSFQAYYKTGYFGIESPRLWKYFTGGQLIKNGSGFQTKHYLIDYKNYFFHNPLEVDLADLNGVKYQVQKKAVLHQVYIAFSSGNAPADVLQLSDSHIPRSVR